MSNQGDEKPLLNVTGAILDAQFDPTNKLLFCLTSELLESDIYQVQPSVSAVNLDTGDVVKLLTLPPQPSVHISLAPDGLALLFDQSTPGTEVNSSVGENDGAEIAVAKVWLLPLYKTSEARLNRQPQQIEPQAFPFAGHNPVWIP